jgi:O-antigen/teichoic acid export membrane protein
MGIVAKQSSQNVLVLVTGLLLGAVNTMWVMPKAFEGFEEGWGLIRILTAWGTLLAQVLAMGMPATMIRFLPKVAKNNARERQLISALLVIPALTFAVVGVVAAFMPADALKWLDAESGWLLEGRVMAFLVMAGAFLAMLLLRALLAHRMRTVAVTFIQEVWLKGSYLALAVLYLQGLMPFETFIRWFLISYAAAVFLMIREAQTVGIRLGRPSFLEDSKPMLTYSAFAFWNVGARVIAKNLDFVMVGALLGLASVPRYTFGFFIATVVATPKRAMEHLLRAITSQAVNAHGPESSGGALQQSARVQLAASASLLVAIWAGMPYLDLAMGEGYRGLQWVVLAIGLTHVAEASAGTAGPILQFSSRYRHSLPLNLGLVVLTILTNFLFIPDQLQVGSWNVPALGWGVEGAAWATGLTGFWIMAWQTSLMWRLFKIHPFSRAWVSTAGLSVLVAVLSRLAPVPEVGAWSAPVACLVALAVGGVAGGTVLVLAWRLGALPELEHEIQQRRGRL